MFASLTSLLGGGFVFPYELGEMHTISWGRWEHLQAKRQEDGKSFSCFRLTAKPSEHLILEAARNGIKRLRMTKHPRIPAFEWTGEKEEKGDVILYLVTEAVTPLADVLNELALEGMQREMFLAMGIRQIAQAVGFLNNQCKLIHGNICMSTVVVTDDLDWKVMYLDMLSEHANMSTSLLARCGKFVQEQFKSAELQRGDMDAVSQGPPWCVDSWGMGCLMQEVFSNSVLASVDQLRNVEAIPKEVLQDYQKLLGQNPARRLNPQKLMESEFLKNDLVDVVHFLESLSIRDVLEKDKFFRQLPQQIPQFPPAICTRKLLPLISSALEYGGAPAMALGCLLQVGKMLDDADFQARVIPIISTLFSSNDRSIRRSLINSMSEYAPFLTEAVVESSIYPQLTKGLSEHNAYLREQTLKAMLPLAPKLSQRTLNTSLLKHLAKLQVDEEPSIRANTTVLLGNIANLLGETACKRILLNAFTRALKDVFAPSRVAALKALMATSHFHSPEDVAQRVVPSISPMCLDSVGEVRKAACKAMEYFVKTLTKASSDMDKGIDPSAAKQADDVKSSATSYMEWAMSTIAAATVGSITGTTPQTTPSKPALDTSGRLNSTNSTASVSGRAARASTGASPKRDLDANGWDDMDDEFEVHGSNGASGELRTAGRLSSTVDTSSLNEAIRSSTGDGWDNNDGWDEPVHSDKPAIADKPPRRAPRTSTTKPAKIGIVKKRDAKGD